ncbi:hypothetical protein AB0C02_12795 [Micromonospora sp. NPDC048999]|uniref:hypothetical protein n=1 Tax=Micromonospora sp. NPDC048999 TaxID=3155391 RepID=UPI0033F09FC7
MTNVEPDHFPAHVKNSYVNCDEYVREARLTPPPPPVAASRASGGEGGATGRRLHLVSEAA